MYFSSFLSYRSFYNIIHFRFIFFVLQKKILKDNRELITVTTMTTCTKLDENYPDAFDLYDDMSDDMDDDHDFYIEDDDDDDESYDDYMFGLAMHGGGSDDEYDEALKYFDAIF